MKLWATIAGYWSAGSPRERAAVGGAAALVVAAALYVFLWEPGLAARQSLSAALPRLRAQLEDMRWEREEIAALRKELGATARRGDLAVVVRASAAQTAFASKVERIEALPDGRVRMIAGPVPFAAWLAWIESLQRELGVRVDTSRISALDQPGLVRLEASFASADAAGGAR